MPDVMLTVKPGSRWLHRERLPPMPLRQISLKLPEDELDQVMRTARAKGISASEYMRRAIHLQLDRDRGTDPAGQARAEVEREDA